jgi:YHS domain-containing protein
MTPWRLFVLALLGYIAWRLLRGLLGGRESRRDPSDAVEAGPPADDVLVEDPVCHVLLPRGQAIRLRRGDKTLFFCSERCCDIYVREHEKEEQ